MVKEKQALIDKWRVWVKDAGGNPDYATAVIETAYQAGLEDPDRQSEAKLCIYVYELQDKDSSFAIRTHSGKVVEIDSIKRLKPLLRWDADPLKPNIVLKKYTICCQQASIEKAYKDGDISDDYYNKMSATNQLNYDSLPPSPGYDDVVSLENVKTASWWF